MSLLRYPTLNQIYQELHRFVEESAEPVAGKPRISAGRDLTRVQWPGVGRFWLTPPQARVVDELLDALLTCRSAEVDQGHLLRLASVTGAQRLADVFRDSPAWGTLVIPGTRPGTYRLPALPPPPPDEAA